MRPGDEPPCVNLKQHEKERKEKVGDGKFPRDQGAVVRHMWTQGWPEARKSW